MFRTVKDLMDILEDLPSAAALKLDGSDISHVNVQYTASLTQVDLVSV